MKLLVFWLEFCGKGWASSSCLLCTDDVIFCMQDFVFCVLAMFAVAMLFTGSPVT